MNRQIIFIVIIVISLALTGYIWLRYANRPSPMIGEEFAAESPEEELRQLRRIKEITLDTSVFQDRFFQALTEPALPPETAIQAGRANPFEPL